MRNSLPPGSGRLLPAILAAAILLFAAAPLAASADDPDGDSWSPHFYGINWELAGSFGNSAPGFDTAQIDALSLTFAYGRRGFLGPVPVRARAGLGWWPGRPFGLLAGVEIGLLELQSQARTRMLGLYLYGDAHALFTDTGVRFSFEPSIRLLIPVHGMGGIAVGAGWDTSRSWTWHIELMSGIHPLK